MNPAEPVASGRVSGPLRLSVSLLALPLRLALRRALGFQVGAPIGLIRCPLLLGSSYPLVLGRAFGVLPVDLRDLLLPLRLTRGDVRLELGIVRPLYRGRLRRRIRMKLRRASAADDAERDTKPDKAAHVAPEQTQQAVAESKRQSDGEASGAAGQ